MLAAPTTTAVTYEQQRAFAVRTFPKGCSPSSPLVGREPGEVPSATSEPDPVEPSQPPEPPPPLEKDAFWERIASLKPSFGLKPVVKPEPVPFLNANPHRHDFPKRRRVSAIRSFPAGCGRDAPPLSRVKREEVDTSSEIKISETPVEGSVRAAPSVKVDTKSDGNSGKQTQKRDRVIYAETGLKSAQRSSESISDRKLEERAAAQTDEKPKISESQESKPSSSTARTQSGTKLVDKGTKTLVDETAIDGSTKNQKEPKDRTRKSLENKVNGSSDARNDKLIVQCLMAAPNCPWRQGRRSSAVRSQPATPKTKTMKGKDSLSK